MVFNQNQETKQVQRLFFLINVGFSVEYLGQTAMYSTDIEKKRKTLDENITHLSQANQLL